MMNCIEKKKTNVAISSKKTMQHQDHLNLNLNLLNHSSPQTHISKHYIGIASKEHVDIGREAGICQFCHGKLAPAKKLKRGDWVIYYSGKYSIDKSDLHQKFTAIGIVTDDAPYQIEQFPGFTPFRRNVKYFDSQEVSIRPLIDALSFIKNKASWGLHFRYGFFEIDRESFDVIARAMFGDVSDLDYAY